MIRIHIYSWVDCIGNPHFWIVSTRSTIFADSQFEMYIETPDESVKPAAWTTHRKEIPTNSFWAMELNKGSITLTKTIYDN